MQSHGRRQGIWGLHPHGPPKTAPQNENTSSLKLIPHEPAGFVTGKHLSWINPNSTAQVLLKIQLTGVDGLMHGLEIHLAHLKR